MNAKVVTMLSELSDTSLSRRRLLKWGVAGAGMTALPLLAACGGGDDDDDDDGAEEPAAEATTPPEEEEPAADEESPSTDETEPAEEEEEPSDEEQGQASGGEVQMFWRDQNPRTLSPIFSSAGDEQQVERLIFGALVKITGDLEPVPDLAANIEVSDDASTFTFSIHENATFNDGEPLTSEDVRFTMERCIDERTGSYWRGRLLGIAGAEEYSDDPSGSVSGIETPDDHTVTITVDPPDSAFLINLGDFSGLGIVPKHILEDVAPEDLADHQFSLAPTVGAGPFNFIRMESDQFLELERNDTYWGDPPPLDRIFLRFLEPGVAVAQLETGEIHLAEVNNIDDLDRVRNMEGVTLESVESPSMDFLTINLEDREFLMDKRVRQAMMYALDRQGIVDAVYQGEATVVNQPVMYGPEWMGEPPDDINQYEYDPDRARELLEEAGWDTNQEVVLSFTNPNAVRQAYFPIIQEQFRAVGIQLELFSRPPTDSVVETMDWDMWQIGGGVFRADPSVAAKYMTTENWTPAGGNYGHYSNDEVDELFPQARTVADPEERKQVYDDIVRILNDEVPWIYLWSPNSHYGVSDQLVGFEAPSYIDNELWNAETWSVRES